MWNEIFFPQSEDAEKKVCREKVLYRKYICERERQKQDLVVTSGKKMRIYYITPLARVSSSTLD